jgi:hypothetical protein
VTAPGPVSADLLREPVDTFQQGEAGESLPLLFLVRQMSDTGTRAELGLKLEEQVDERDVVERLREGGLGLGKDKVARLDHGESGLQGDRLL